MHQIRTIKRFVMFGNHKNINIIANTERREELL